MKAGAARRRCVWGLIAVVVLAARAAGALPAYGPLQVTGNLQSQTLIRNPDIDKYQLVQNRNTLRLRVDFDWLKNGKVIDKFTVPWIRSSHLFLLYRGVYDSVYDLAPGGNLHDILGRSVGSLDSLPSNVRDGLKYENVLREAFIDVDFRDIPLSLRLGRQQIVWGESDNFRMLDRANPLDLTWHQLYESWDDLRRPLWMIKALWRFGYIEPLSLSDAFLETYWDPGDWQPAKQGFMPEYPWGISSPNPLNGLIGPPPTGLGYTGLFRGTTLFNQGDYTRNPGGNSQLGVRVSAVTPQGIQFTLNYFYQRWAGDDGTNYAPVRALRTRAELNEARRNRQVPAVFIAPYINTAGFSLNYSDEDYTQTVYRLETIYDFGIPFSDTAKPSPEPLFRNQLFDITRRDMWKGMIAFDRPTWIRFLNRNSTFFLTGQFFWHYLIHKEPSFIGNVDPQVPSQDHIHEWEVIATLLLTTFYAGGSIVPTVSYGLDPVNTYNMYIGWTLDYFLTNDFIVRVGQNYFVLPGIPPAFESWSLGGFNRGRSESLLRLTYQF
jgi:hypothetical protein